MENLFYIHNAKALRCAKLCQIICNVFIIIYEPRYINLNVPFINIIYRIFSILLTTVCSEQVSMYIALNNNI